MSQSACFLGVRSVVSIDGCIDEIVGRVQLDADDEARWNGSSYAVDDSMKEAKAILRMYRILILAIIGLVSS